MASIKEARKVEPRIKMSLLTTRPILPGGISSSAICDYWAPPLLSGDHRRKVERIVLIEPPVRMVVDGAYGPRVSEQHLAVITVGGGSDELPTPTISYWTEAPTDISPSDALVLDFPIEAHDAINDTINTFESESILHWSRPTGSPSDRDFRRAIYGYTRAGMDKLEVAVLVRRLRQHISHVQHAVIGHTSMLEDPAALLVDYTTPAALTAYPDYYDQVILLTSRRGAIITTTDKTKWERLLTQQGELNTDDRIKQLSWRRSTRGGRPWVCPQLLAPARVASLRGDWDGQTCPTRNTIHVQIQGDIGSDPAPWMAHLLSKVTAATPGAWTSVSMGTEPQVYQLAPIPCPDGHWDGGVLVIAPTPANTCAIASVLNACCIRGVTGTHRVGVRVSHDYTDTERGNRAAGNGSRGSRGAGRPPLRR